MACDVCLHGAYSGCPCCSPEELDIPDNPCPVCEGEGGESEYDDGWYWHPCKACGGTGEETPGKVLDLANPDKATYPGGRREP